MDLASRVVKYLAACPPAVSGQSGHDQTFAVACALVNGFGLSESDAFDALFSFYNQRCNPPWSEKELRHKARSALNASHSKPRGHLLGSKSFKPEDFKPSSFQTPKYVVDEVKERELEDPKKELEKFLGGFSCAESDLYDASPIKPSDDWHTDGILTVQHLFKAGEHVNYVTGYRVSESSDGKKKATPGDSGVSMERDALIGHWLSKLPKSEAGGWLRMNPLSGQGISDDCVTDFRHILFEFDKMPLSVQLSFFARLPLPISCIMTSGDKSIHAWVRVDCLDHEEYTNTFDLLLKFLGRFGFDRKNKNPSRLSRLPGMERSLFITGDGRQRLLYLNPNPSQERILS